MATSPRTPTPKTPNGSKFNYDKEETFWDKIGTLGRKKRIKEGKDNSIPSCIKIELNDLNFN